MFVRLLKILVKSLINKAMNGKPLSEEQEKVILDMIQENSEILTEIEFTPECFYKLCESNKNFASEIILRISKSNILNQ